jgi:hypothetical protein
MYARNGKTHNTLLLATAESEPLAANDSQVALRELPQIFLKFTRFDCLVVQGLVKVRVSDNVVPN